MAARPVPLAVAGAVFIAFSGILVRLADTPPSTAAVYRCVYALPLLALLAAWERRRYGARPLRQRSLAWIAGLLFAVDLVAWHHCIAAVGAGLATVLGNIQVVVVALAAWALLKERPEARALAAVPIVLVGVVLISGVVGADAYGEDPALGVAYGVLTALAYSGFLLVLRAGNADVRRPGGPLFDATLAAGLGSLAIGLPLGELELVPTWPAHGWLVALALSSQVVGWLLIAISLPRLPALVTSILLTLQPVATVILSAVLLGEDPSLVQLAGVAAIVAGIVIASTGRRGERAPEPVLAPAD